MKLEVEKLRNRLKLETAELHRRTEMRSALMPLFKGGVWSTDLDRAYQRNLMAQGKLIEFVLDQKSEWIQFTPSLEVLENCLGAVSLDLNGDGAVQNGLQPLENHTAEVIGVGYVMLGSSMGSKVILSKLGNIIPQNRQFFLKAMAEASVNFMAFCEELNHPEIAEDASISGAKRAFQYLAEHS